MGSHAGLTSSLIFYLYATRQKLPIALRTTFGLEVLTKSKQRLIIALKLSIGEEL